MAVTAHLLSALRACRSLLGRLGFWGCCACWPAQVRCTLPLASVHRPPHDFLQLQPFYKTQTLRTSTVLQCQSAVVYIMTQKHFKPSHRIKYHAAVQWHAAAPNKTFPTH